MKEGMYAVQYNGPQGQVGWGMIVFESGKLWGADPLGTQFDGDYEYDSRTDELVAKVHINFRPNANLVTGHSVGADGMETDVDVRLPKNLDTKVSVPLTLFGVQLVLTIGKVREAPLDY